MTNCLYCTQPTEDDDLHFVSGCCGRGMCEDCYNGDTGTMDQFQPEYCDEEDYDKIKEEYIGSGHLCFDCTEIWMKEEFLTK